MEHCIFSNHQIQITHAKHKTWLKFSTFPPATPTPATPMSFRLERAFPVNNKIPISELRERDTIRHRRLLKQSDVVVDFPLKGDSDPYNIG